MVNITLALPENLHNRMIRHSEIKWSEVARKAFESKLNEADIDETILSKSKLTMKDVEEISSKIKKEIAKELR
mgnify:CR=1 FL=1